MKVGVIFKKELYSYFRSPIAYIVIGISLLLSGYFFFTDTIYFNITNMGGVSLTVGLWQFFFMDLRLVFLLTLPLLTMRLFAEEKKSGTIELLLTCPLREIDIILGKFAACMVMLFLILLLTLLYPLLLATIWKLEPPPLSACYLGTFLLGCAFISGGIFVSSLTENQIVAAVGTYGLLVLLWFLTWNEAIAAPGVVAVLTRLSLFDHIYNFTRGIIETGDLVFFFLFPFFFLFLTLRSLQLRRYTRGRDRLNCLVSSIAILAIIVLVELISSRHNQRWDLTLEQRYSLSEQAKKILKGLEKDITVTSFYKSGDLLKFQNILKLYSAQSPRFNYQLVNLDQSPIMAKKYRIKDYGSTVIESAGKTKIIPYPGEELIINAIIEVTQERQKFIYFATGHGENNVFNNDPREGYSAVKYAVEREGYRVRGLLLKEAGVIPRDCSALIISGPKEDLTHQELQRLAQFLGTGGSILLMIDPIITAPRLASFLDQYSIILGGGVVVDQSSRRVFGGDILTPVIPIYRRHPITQGFQVATIHPLVRRVEVREALNGDISANTLALSDIESWEETDLKDYSQENISFQKGVDKEGPIPVAVVVEIKKGGKAKADKGVRGGRLAVFGDSGFANNFYLNALGNRDLFLNTVNWLAEAEHLISLRRKGIKYEFDPLTVRQSRLVFWPTVIFQPCSILLIGIIVFIRRKIKG